MGFLYYIGGLTTPPHNERLKLAGLDATFYRAEIDHRGVEQAGPDKGSGCVITPRSPHQLKPTPLRDIGYFKDKQRWIEIDGGKYWLGWFTDRPMPTCSDLIREKVTPGNALVLGDGSKWLIPEYTSIPKTFALDDDGEEIAIVPNRLKAFDSGVQTMLREMSKQVSEADASDSIDTSYSSTALLYLAVEALAVNYRTNRKEAAALGILTTENVVEICWSALGVAEKPTVIEG